VLRCVEGLRLRLPHAAVSEFTDAIVGPARLRARIEPRGSGLGARAASWHPRHFFRMGFRTATEHCSTASSHLLLASSTHAIGLRQSLAIPYEFFTISVLIRSHILQVHKNGAGLYLICPCILGYIEARTRSAFPRTRFWCCIADVHNHPG